MVIDESLEMKLLRGDNIPVQGVGVLRSHKLREICDIGLGKYNQYLSNLIIKKSDIQDILEDYDIDIEPYVFIASNCMQEQNTDYRNMILNAFSMFFGEPVHFNRRGFFYLGKEEELRVIYEDNFKEITNIIKIINYIDPAKEKEEEYNPANETAKAFIKQLRKNKKARKAAKRKDESTLNTIISGVAWKSQIGIDRIWDLTIYQLFDAYYRLEIMDNYNHTMSGIFAGTVDQSKINLKEISWTRKI